MDSQEHARILNRVGWVLVMVGAVDVAIMVYCIVNRVSYSSSFNIFSIIAGVFLLRGSLGAAALVRWMAVFMLAAMATMLLSWPLLQAPGLVLLQLRLNPLWGVLGVLLSGLVLWLLVWVIRELGHEPIAAARLAAGRKVRNMRIPAAVGIGMVVAMNGFLILLLGGESGEHARTLARQSVGPGYELQVSSLNVNTGARGKVVSAVVIAWNDREVRYIPVSWRE